MPCSSGQTNVNSHTVCCRRHRQSRSFDGQNSPTAYPWKKIQNRLTNLPADECRKRAHHEWHEYQTPQIICRSNRCQTPSIVVTLELKLRHKFREKNAFSVLSQIVSAKQTTYIVQNWDLVCSVHVLMACNLFAMVEIRVTRFGQCVIEIRCAWIAIAIWWFSICVGHRIRQPNRLVWCPPNWITLWNCTTKCGFKPLKHLIQRLAFS